MSTPAQLLGFRDATRTALEAHFADGVRLQIHQGASGTYYAMRPFGPEAGPTPRADDRTRAYQRTALEAFFAGAPHNLWVDRSGDLAAMQAI